MKLLRENLNQNSVFQKHKANKHITRKTIGCFAKTIGYLYQFTNIKLNLKSLRIERMHTEVYTGSLLNQELHPGFPETTGESTKQSTLDYLQHTKEVTLIPSRHTLPLAQHNTTKNVDLDNLKNTQHFLASHTEFLQSTKDYTCYRKDLKSIQDENPISHSFLSKQSQKQN